MKKVLLSFFLIFSFSINAYGWEKVPIPDYVNKKTKSPWNFFDNFEDRLKPIKPAHPVTKILINIVNILF